MKKTIYFEETNCTFWVAVKFFIYLKLNQHIVLDCNYLCLYIETSKSNL